MIFFDMKPVFYSRYQRLDIKKAGSFLTLLFKYFCFYSDVLDSRLLSFPLLLSLPDLRSGICPLYENCRLSITNRLPPLSGNMCFIYRQPNFVKASQNAVIKLGAY